jgi:hypothetical protein
MVYLLVHSPQMKWILGGQMYWILCGKMNYFLKQMIQWVMIRETVVIYWVVVYSVVIYWVCILGQDHWIIYRLGVVAMGQDR